MTRTAALPTLLGGLLLAVYMCFYVASPITIDGEATLAVATSLVKYGSPDIDVMGAAEGLLPPESRMGSFGLDGHLYAKKGIVPSLLLLPLVVVAQLIPALTPRAAAMLLNPLILTATALLLYRFAHRLNFTPRHAFLAGLIFGLGSFAVAYSQTLFGEPLAALLLLAAVHSAYEYHETSRIAALLICGSALGLLVGVNLTYVLIAPLLGLYCFGLDPRRWSLTAVARIALPFVIIVAALLAYNMLRFGNPLSSGYNFAEGEGFNQPLGLGVFGLWLSPYRGIFWYCPLLLLVIWGIGRFDQHRLRVLILLLAVIQTATYASWWSWHGGFVWGPRFLLPILPLLILFVLPAMQQRVGMILTVVLAIISALIQVPAVLYDFVPYTVSLYDNFALGVAEGFYTGLRTEVYLRPDLSPILGQMRVLVSGSQPLRPALLQGGQSIVHLALVMLILAASLVAWRWSAHRTVRAAIILTLLGIFGIACTHSSRNTAFNQTFGAADQIVAASTDYGIALVDLDSRARIVTTNAPTRPDDPLAAGLWSKAMQRSGLTWFITWFSPANPENWQELDLWQHASFVRELIFNEDRALLFDLTSPPAATQAGGWRFGPMTLDAYGLSHDTNGLRLTLAWSASGEIDQDLSWFVHLLNAQGQIVQQQDRAPQGGYLPTSGWKRDVQVLDHLFFPGAFDFEGWHLRIGVVGSAGSLIPPSESQNADYVLLPLE